MEKSRSNEKLFSEKLGKIIYNDVMNRSTELCNKFHHAHSISHSDFTGGIIRITEEAHKAILDLILEVIPEKLDRPNSPHIFEYPDGLADGQNACREEMLKRLE